MSSVICNFAALASTQIDSSVCHVSCCVFHINTHGFGFLYFGTVLKRIYYSNLHSWVRFENRRYELRNIVSFSFASNWSFFLVFNGLYQKSKKYCIMGGYPKQSQAKTGINALNSLLLNQRLFLRMRCDQSQWCQVFFRPALSNYVWN